MLAEDTLEGQIIFGVKVTCHNRPLLSCLRHKDRPFPVIAKIILFGVKAYAFKIKVLRHQNGRGKQKDRTLFFKNNPKTMPLTTHPII
jgi:hypothetical protein